MSIGSRIKERREQLGITQVQLAKLLGVTKGAIGNYESGANSPKASMLYKVFDVLQCDANYIFQDEMRELDTSDLSSVEIILAKKYRALDEHGKDIVDTVLEKELARVNEPDSVTELHSEKVIPLLGNSYAAGGGEPDFGNFWEDYAVPADSPADFAIRISGDSMEPWIPDGSIQLCTRVAPRDGDVGAFLIEGEYLCKQVCMDVAGTLHLFSLNRTRKNLDRDIPRDEIERQVMCFGTVIMKRRVPLPID